MTIELIYDLNFEYFSKTNLQDMLALDKTQKQHAFALNERK
jgi:hypothetical protein